MMYDTGKRRRQKLRNVFCTSYITSIINYYVSLFGLLLLLSLSTPNSTIDNNNDYQYLYVSSFTATICYHYCRSNSKSISTSKIASNILYKYHHRNRIIELQQTKLHLSSPQLLQQQQQLQQQNQQQQSVYSISKVPPIITTPLPNHTFAGIVEQILIDKFGSDEEHSIHRIIQSWRLLENNYVHDVSVIDCSNNSNNAISSIESTDTSSIVDEDSTNKETIQINMMKQYCHSYVPGLRIQPFWNSTHYNWCNKLQSKYKLILKEFTTVTNNIHTLQTNGNNVWSSALNNDAISYGIGWKTLVLMDRGIWDPINVNLFPITSTIIYNLNIPCTEIFFASMEPYSTIKVHSDFTNFVLTCHLGLLIPYNGCNICNITVGSQTEQWYNGQIKLFDTSLLHSAINDSNETRYILMFRVWHPDLTTVERNAIQFTYNCLNNPNLVTNYYTNTIERNRIEQSIQQQMKFPLLLSSSSSSSSLSKSSSSSSSSSGKSGFGIQKQQQQPKKKKK